MNICVFKQSEERNLLLEFLLQLIVNHCDLDGVDAHLKEIVQCTHLVRFQKRLKDVYDALFNLVARSRIG
ncbi:hypothetical protein D3C81_2247610 [compost metagenome]